MQNQFKWMLMLVIVALLVSACSGGDGASESEEPEEQTETGAPVDENKDSIDKSDGDVVAEVPTQSVVLYFSDDQLLHIYKVQAEIEAEDDKAELIQAVLDKWREGPEQDDLQNLLPQGTSLTFMGEQEEIAQVSFSPEIFEANLGSTGEAALVDQVVMIMQQFGYEQTQILVDGEIVDSILNHMQLNVPVEAKDPDHFDWYNET